MDKQSLDLVRDNLKRLRSQSNLTQEDLAEKSGLSAGFIARVESGTVGISLKAIDALSHALNVKSMEFFLDEDSREIFHNYKSSLFALKFQELIDDYVPNGGQKILKKHKL